MQGGSNDGEFLLSSESVSLQLLTGESDEEAKKSALFPVVQPKHVIYKNARGLYQQFVNAFAYSALGENLPKKILCDQANQHWKLLRNTSKENIQQNIDALYQDGNLPNADALRGTGIPIVSFKQQRERIRKGKVQKLEDSSTNANSFMTHYMPMTMSDTNEDDKGESKTAKNAVRQLALKQEKRNSLEEMAAIDTILRINSLEKNLLTALAEARVQKEHRMKAIDKHIKRLANGAKRMQKMRERKRNQQQSQAQLSVAADCTSSDLHGFEDLKHEQQQFIEENDAARSV